MKKVLFVVALFISSLAFAQTNVEDVDLVQAIYGKEKKTLMSEFVTLDEAQKDTFWKLYDEYEVKRKELGKKRVDLLEQYSQKYMDLDDESTTALINQSISLGESTDKLIAEYFRKMSKSVGVKPAAQFYQLEGFLLNEIRAGILENIPFIGELD